MIARRHRIVSVFHPFRMLTMDDMEIFLKMPHSAYRSYRDADRTDFILMVAFCYLSSCWHS